MPGVPSPLAGSRARPSQSEGESRVRYPQVRRRAAMIAPLLALIAASFHATDTPHAAQAPASAGGDAAALRTTLDTYCVTCHNQRARTSGLALDEADLRAAANDPELWETVVRKVRTGVMPPAGVPRPDAASRAALVSW